MILKTEWIKILSNISLSENDTRSYTVAHLTKKAVKYNFFGYAVFRKAMHVTISSSYMPNYCTILLPLSPPPPPSTPLLSWLTRWSNWTDIILALLPVKVKECSTVSCGCLMDHTFTTLSAPPVTRWFPLPLKHRALTSPSCASYRSKEIKT